MTTTAFNNPALRNLRCSPYAAFNKRENSAIPEIDILNPESSLNKKKARYEGPVTAFDSDNSESDWSSDDDEKRGNSGDSSEFNYQSLITNFKSTKRVSLKNFLKDL